MQDFRVIEYIPTPSAKQEGICYIGVNSALGELMLGFKIVMKKDGSGTFIAEPTWKLEENGQEQWKPWIMIDSNIAKERLRTFIMDYVAKNHRRSHNGVGQALAGQPQQNTSQQQTFLQNASKAQNAYPTERKGEDVPF